jgi:hypothetical protein
VIEKHSTEGADFTYRRMVVTTGLYWSFEQVK